MKTRISSMLVIVSLFWSINLWADDIRLGEPAVAGSGCPSGTVSTVLSPDQKQLSILFDEYIVEAGSNGKKLSRKSCNIAIPVHVPQGFSVSIFKVDYRGYAYVPRRGMGSFKVEYFFAGQRGPRLAKSFRGGFDDEFTFTNKLAAYALVWSKCGADVNLRVNSSMLLKTNNNYDDAMASVDSVDVDSGIIYHIQWKRCN